jgi:alpha-N-acetylglucosaminidase
LPGDLLPAWDDFIIASQQLKNSDGFQYDLVDVTRQVLANYADTLQREFAAAYKEKDAKAFKKYRTRFLMVMDDMDKLLATRKDFLLGKWLNDAKKWGVNAGEKKLYGKNARDLITLWGDKNSTLHEYSCRQWSGMISGFYKPRWEQFFAYVNKSMQHKQEAKQDVFDEKIKNWEWNWVNGNEKYTDVAKGNPVAVSCLLYKKYHRIVKDKYARRQ